MLNDIKTALRISQSNTAFDTEIIDLIEAARLDLMISGISQEKASSDKDPLIKRAITIYCKANYGFDNPDFDRLQKSYAMLKQHLSLTGDYRVE
ncbi:MULTISPECIES: head-tail connector protein [unclassified Sutcliffiella]|uniref:head-tail connector protein n=1 Tax=unclassified Sutcliffiella TaxID=2837532 RepID=UPI0030D2E00C